MLLHNMSPHRPSPKSQAVVDEMAGIRIPTKVKEALKDPKWVTAIQVEMDALQENDTWSILSLPKRKKLMGCKWVFTIEHKPDRTIYSYKMRFVTKCYTQIFGIDYQETFAPVAKINKIRVLLSLAANFDWALK